MPTEQENSNPADNQESQTTASATQQVTPAGDIAQQNATLTQQLADLQKRYDTDIAAVRADMTHAERAASLSQENERLKPLAEQAEASEQALNGLIETQVAQLPDDLQTAVKELPLDGPAKAAWLQKHMATLNKPTTPNFRAGEATLGSGASQLSTADREAMERAEERGQPFKNEADYLTHKAKAKELWS